MPEDQPQHTASAFWAIVEIFGHQRIAGLLSEQTIGGQSFVRVDVPELPARAASGYDHGEGPVSAHSKLYGGGAIYAISPVDETVARAAAMSIRHKPVDTYGIEAVMRNMPDAERARLLAGPRDGRGRDPDDDNQFD